MKSQDLKNILDRIDRRGYPAYKDTKGKYEFAGYTLSIDHVQGDPFASPSKISIEIKGETAGFPGELWDKNCKRIALQDYLLRQFGKLVGEISFKAKGSGKSGIMQVSRPGQEVLQRSGCIIDGKSGDIVVRMEAGFPANGRTVNSRELEKMLFNFLPECVKKSLFYKAINKDEIKDRVELAQNQTYIRSWIKENDMIAFVADGSVLPRESGVSGKPMKGAVPFKSPESMKVSIELPNKKKITGMGIKKGITLIVGGGYHGKSTLLKALETGVYNHVGGDGREYVITDDTAVKIRAEDGRSIKGVDISMFINNLPNGKDTLAFDTDDASGSTSQAANVIEAIESGAGTLLMDEDTSATNFMVRDELMQMVVNRESEPIVPFIDRVREIYEDSGISVILVAGSSGSYFYKADKVIQMNRYEPDEITEFAKEQAEKFSIPKNTVPKKDIPGFKRVVSPVRSYKTDDRLKVKTMGCDSFSINHDVTDLRYVEQIVDTEQVNMLAYLTKYAQTAVFDGNKTLIQSVDELCRILQECNYRKLCAGSYIPCGLAEVRRQEIFACINRFRKLRILKK